MNLNRSILVVDDEQTVAENYAELFRRQGWLAKAVFDGESALAAIRDQEFGVVVLDMRMPGMDGFETLSAILRKSPEQCVVFFTAYGEVETAVRALRQGAWSMILKGLRFEELAAAVEVALVQTTKQRMFKEERDRAIANEAKMKSTMTLGRGISHQLKNRLVDFGVRLDLLESADSIADVQKRVPELRESLDLAFMAVNRLVRFGQAQSIERKPVSLLDVIREGARMAKQRHRNHRVAAIRLTPQLNGEMQVVGDWQFLAELFECLFDNAVEAMINDGGSVEVTAETADQRVDVTVTDTGSGFTADMLGKAHEPFCTTKDKSNIGFGLTFAKEVAKSFGGSLEYGNRPDRRGAWVRVQLPLELALVKQS